MTRANNRSTAAGTIEPCQQAAAEGRTLTSLIADGLRMVVADDRKPAKAKRVLPPVSKQGGLLLGVDLKQMHLTQEAEDIDAVRRLTRLK